MPPKLSNLTQVLLVEDNEEHVQFLTQLLATTEGSRYNLAYASTLQEGLKAMESSPPDLVLLDLSLPDSDGLETFIRMIELGRDTADRGPFRTQRCVAGDRDGAAWGAGLPGQGSR